jgi:hypothetical protein
VLLYQKKIAMPAAMFSGTWNHIEKSLWSVEGDPGWSRYRERMGT